MATLTPEECLLELRDPKAADAVAQLLTTLLEPSRPLREVLLPAVLLQLTARPQPPASFNEVVDICISSTDDWTWDQKANFISGHPLIGEVGGMSAHSTKEQSKTPTRPVVLERLAHLNAVYSTVFPGLRYVTFVNGRPREEIVPEMEAVIGLSKSPSPLPDSGFEACLPCTLSDDVRALVRAMESDEWCTECDRAMKDVWLIARARLSGMGLK